MGVDTDTVDNRILETPPGANDDEYQISRNFTYMVRTVRNVRVLNDVYVKIRKQKDWGSNPHLLSLNGSFPKFLEDLPPDMQIHYPSDGSPPWLPSTFVGNMHCYYLLSNILLHRPQLMKSTSFAAGGSWKQHMTLCYDSAKKLCRIQEALLQTYGIDGLICMQRGECSQMIHPIARRAKTYRHQLCNLLHPVVYHASLGTDSLNLHFLDQLTYLFIGCNHLPRPRLQ